MSESTPFANHRAGRIAFGSVLIAGAGILAAHSLAYLGDDDVLPAWTIIVVTWIAAIAAHGLALLLPVSAEPDRLRMTSLVVPAVGVALILPLTIQMPVIEALGGTKWFNSWCGIAAIITAAAHAAFAMLLVERVRAVATGRPTRSLSSVLAIGTLCGGVPGLVLPAALVLVTGLPILATAIPVFDAIAEREQRAELPLPFAIARHA
jgi:NO-binding membrane sensor protein with MHYT domain